ncbi:MAG: protein kinase, partial [Myxococcales bacterium]|nr:protein kinase [Myxococcales bacterium]
GGMGVVFEAIQELPERRVALKTLSKAIITPKALAHFRVEVNATARVVHPAIPQVFEVFEVGNLPVMVMEYVSGLPFDEAAQRWSRDELVRMLRDTCHAVHVVHEHGVIHRDIKPSNVLITDAGTVKVLDFGIAALGGDELLGSCTLGYAAPEQILSAPADVRCDVYGLGALAHKILTGRLPVKLRESDSLADMIKAKAQPILAPKELPSSLGAIIQKAVSPEPSGRYPSALALAEEFDRYLNWQPVHALRSWGEPDTLSSSELRTHRSADGWAGYRFDVRGSAANGVLASAVVRPLGVDQWFDVPILPEVAAATLVVEDFVRTDEAKGTAAVVQLFLSIFSHALESETLLIATACAPVHYLEMMRLGFRVVGPISRGTDDSTLVPMMLVVHDLNQLSGAKSPLAALLRTRGHLDERRGIDWINQQLGVGGAAPSMLSLLGDDEITSPLLVGLSSLGRAELLRDANRRPGNVGDTLIDVGESGKWMALVEAGLVEIVVDGRVIAVRGEGELIGEMGFLLDVPRTARVVVAAPATILVLLGPEVVDGLSSMADRERVWRNLAVILAQKLELQTRHS